MTFKLAGNCSTNVRYASEALAKFTIDATALRRGSSRSQLRQTARGSVLSLHGTSPWDPDHSAAHISYKRELPRRKAVASMVNFATASEAYRTFVAQFLEA